MWPKGGVLISGVVFLHYFLLLGPLTKEDVLILDRRVALWSYYCLLLLQLGV